ncbi:hypothetical protein INT45_009866 [Circinella minor]|uniref:Uncharacterized protein n=1 Tax=Circinella minor TaxID=1195481 RepID=A0A8H7RZ74_9FUNG|nr:hypothetical protein INT45_009866 [Circinella minor]
MKLLFRSLWMCVQDEGKVAKHAVNIIKARSSSSDKKDNDDDNSDEERSGFASVDNENNKRKLIVPTSLNTRQITERSRNADEMEENIEAKR